MAAKWDNSGQKQRESNKVDCDTREREKERKREREKERKREREKERKREREKERNIERKTVTFLLGG